MSTEVALDLSDYDDGSIAAHCCQGGDVEIEVRAEGCHVRVFMAVECASNLLNDLGNAVARALKKMPGATP